MGLYNMLHGTNPASGILLRLLGMDSFDEVGRFRDAYVAMADADLPLPVTKDLQGEPIICIYTRNGGGNREHYGFDEGDPEEGEGCDCTACVMRYRVPKHPAYLGDRDDDYDATYATIYYAPPNDPEMREFLRLMALSPEDRPAQVWEQLIGALEKPIDQIPEDGTKGERIARSLLAKL